MRIFMYTHTREVRSSSGSRRPCLELLGGSSLYTGPQVLFELCLLPLLTHHPPYRLAQQSPPPAERSWLWSQRPWDQEDVKSLICPQTLLASLGAAHGDAGLDLPLKYSNQADEAHTPLLRKCRRLGNCVFLLLMDHK